MISGRQLMDHRIVSDHPDRHDYLKEDPFNSDPSPDKHYFYSDNYDLYDRLHRLNTFRDESDFVKRKKKNNKKQKQKQNQTNKKKKQKKKNT